jgi:hypothetical protein
MKVRNFQIPENYGNLLNKKIGNKGYEPKKTIEFTGVNQKFWIFYDTGCSHFVI